LGVMGTAVATIIFTCWLNVPGYYLPHGNVCNYR
jgi:hypothetical protein